MEGIHCSYCNVTHRKLASVTKGDLLDQKVEGPKAERGGFRTGLIQGFGDIIEAPILVCLSGWSLADSTLFLGWLPSEWQNSYNYRFRFYIYLLHQWGGENEQALWEEPRTHLHHILLLWHRSGALSWSVNPFAQDKCAPDCFGTRWTWDSIIWLPYLGTTRARVGPMSALITA